MAAVSDIKHILVTTDFSKASAAAYPVARELLDGYAAQGIKAHVSMVYVLEQTARYYEVEFGVTGIDFIELEERSVKAATEKLEALTNKHFADYKASSHILNSHHAIPDKLTEFATEHSVSMIVMSTHGRSGVRHLFLGSVAERILRAARCPVVAVPCGDVG